MKDKNRVLIVDDVLTNQMILEKVFSDMYDTVTAVNGIEALEIMQSMDIAVVLLDLSMPILDGFGVLERMRKDTALSQIPVLVITASEDKESQDKALELGAFDVITKPFNSQTIRVRVRNIVTSANNKQLAMESEMLKKHIEHQNELISISEHDSKTGVYNRDTFCRIAAEMITQKPLGYYEITCFDIDSFKAINEQHGTEFGDTVLRDIAKASEVIVAECGGIICREYLDSFAVMYPIDNMVDVVKITEELEKSYNDDGMRIKLNVSAGKYVIDDDTHDIGYALDCAQLAQLSIKGYYGRRVGYYSSDMRDNAHLQQWVTSEMENALKNGQFELWLQPQFNHETGSMIGAEALVRWMHPEQGMISPGIFIPIFESNGFIFELDKFVWEQGCKILRNWNDSGKDMIAISVNVSRYDLFCDELYSTLTGLVERYGIMPECLRLEITETAFSKDTEHIVETIKQLQTYGFTIEIDDFGKGYSSLNTLKDVPADMLKLDMGFLEGADMARRGGSIVECIVRMAEWLGMPVIAEGVETPEQADFLKTIGCSNVQGFLYERPMPVAEFEQKVVHYKSAPKVMSLELVKGLDNNTFWDPDSMDTLIFNSYVGGACIFEYRKGRVELMRANEKYLQVLNNIEITEVMRVDWTTVFEPETRTRIANTLQKAIEMNEECDCEALITNLPIKNLPLYVRAYFRVIASTNDRYLFYCTVENLTAQWIAEEKEREATKKVRAANKKLNTLNVKLHEMNMRLNLIMENMNGAVVAATVVDDKMDFWFMNTQLFEMSGYTKEQFGTQISSIFDLVYEDDKAEVISAIKDVRENGYARSFECRAWRSSGTLAWYRVNVSTMKVENCEQPIMVSIINDCTTEKRAEKKRLETTEQLKFINSVSEDLLNGCNPEKSIENALRKVMAYFDGDRAYIMEFDWRRNVVNNTYEVCKDGVDSVITQQQAIPMELCEFLRDSFNDGEIVHVGSLDEIDVTRENDKKALNRLGVKSIINTPLYQNNNLVGFVGVDNAQKNILHIDRLAALGDCMSAMLIRRNYERELHEDNDNMRKLMSDIPGGFVQIKLLSDGSVIPQFINDGFCRMVGMSHDEVLRFCEGDLIRCVYPEDRDSLLEEITDAARSGKMISVMHRLIATNDSYVWVMTFCTLTKTEGDYSLLNIYCVDYTQQVTADAQKQSLLDKIPCGVGMYAFSGGVVTLLYQNSEYIRIIGRNSSVTGDTIDEFVHPEDRERLMLELLTAIREKRDLICDFRVINGEGSFSMLHTVGRIVLQEDGVANIYCLHVLVDK